MHQTIARPVAYLASGESEVRRFPAAIRVLDAIYASSEPLSRTVPASSEDIGDQTHEAFRDFIGLLETLGGHMSDLVKLHTFYVYEGEKDATAYWEQMTSVRLQYFADPGPAGTALRIKGVPTSRRLIAIDGIARVGAARHRIMPAHAWDWSIPTPLSQGWRVGPVIYAGGQISADRRGRAVAAGDLRQQTINTMEFLRHVLRDGGASFENVVSLKIAYQHRGDDRVAREVLDQILATVAPLVPGGQSALTCLGVDLLYEGLKLEIDAVAVLPTNGTIRSIGPNVDWSGAAGFAAASRADGLIHVGGIGAPAHPSTDAQLHSSLERLRTILSDAGSKVSDLVKLNVLYTSSATDEASDYSSIHSVLDAGLPTPGPVVSIVRVAGLPQAGQRVQIDAVGIASDD